MSGALFFYGEFSGGFAHFPEGTVGVMMLLFAPLFVPLGMVMLGVFNGSDLWAMGNYGRSLISFSLAVGTVLFLYAVWYALYKWRQKQAGCTP